jgi:hypothetical protein
MPRFSRKELYAISEALNHRLAGEIDIEDSKDAPRIEDYESAWSKLLIIIAIREKDHKLAI